MKDIPIPFHLNGRGYQGKLVEVTAAGKLWHLNVDRYYQGQLVCADNYGWKFYPTKGIFRTSSKEKEE
jgi:hypothetical protein